ncbi:predicted protein [Nematostella vectensis]|uniref:Fibroblast growth factor n=1 Tax=Nematostella vectensis TaxID=45351 RepID=A7SH09_NEMVE|nr:fibroblast growth factor 20-like protein [Nematostella vectensis]EDO37008.1 predicted protein [Nematostella vectensis]|eukprot:XP_001629071.1 predicted protein [Nematostella vectensis]
MRISTTSYKGHVYEVSLKLVIRSFNSILVSRGTQSRHGWMAGQSPIVTSLLVLVSLFKSPKPPRKNATTPTSKTKRYSTTGLPSQSPFNQLTGIVRTPTFRRKVKLYCKTGFHLVMLPGGTLKGSLSANITSMYGLFELESYGRSLIRVKSVPHDMYIAISNTGQVYATANTSVETLLRETRAENYFHTFSSYQYNGEDRHKQWYLAIKQNGHVKNASTVLKQHRSHQFQVVDQTVEPLLLEPSKDESNVKQHKCRFL